MGQYLLLLLANGFMMRQRLSTILEKLPAFKTGFISLVAGTTLEYGLYLTQDWLPPASTVGIVLGGVGLILIFLVSLPFLLRAAVAGTQSSKGNIEEST